jgi:hypothetical protein
VRYLWESLNDFACGSTYGLTHDKYCDWFSCPLCWCQTDTPRRVWININSSGSNADWPFKYAPFIAEWICLLVCILLYVGLVNTTNARNIHTCYQMVIHSCQISVENLFVNRKLSHCLQNTTFDTHSWPTCFEFSHCPIILAVTFVGIGSSGTSRLWKMKGRMFLPHVEYRLHSSAASCPRRTESSTSEPSRLQNCHVCWFSSVSLDKFRCSNLPCLSRWPRCISCRSGAAWLLGSRVRIPLKVWLFAASVCCVGSGFCEELVTLSDESYRVCVCVCVCVCVM